MRRYPLLKIPTIADRMHVSDVMYVLRFIQVTKPIIASRIIRFQVEPTNNIVVLAVFMFMPNILVKKLNFNTTEAPFQTETWPSPSQLTFMTVDNVIIHPSSDLYCRLTSTEFEKVYVHRFTSLRRYVGRFLSKIECCNVVSDEILFYDIHIVK